MAIDSTVTSLRTAASDLAALAATVRAYVDTDSTHGVTSSASSTIQGAANACTQAADQLADEAWRIAHQPPRP